MSERRALITGISGQDGSYLAELLVGDGYAVTGVVRDPAGALPNLAAVAGHVELVQGDLLDPGSLRAAVALARPDEIYHLAAPTFVPSSWEDPGEVMAAITGSTSALLAAALTAGARIWVAASSELYGDTDESPQHERSAMRPRSPYGAAKLAGHALTGAMRERHGLFACSGITYNHESPRRPQHFVSRKITRGAAAIALGIEDRLVLGDLAAVRDWTHARDVVRGAWLALQAPQPRDYVLASGTGRQVRDLVAAAFAAAGTDPEGRVEIDPAFVRPPEPVALVGDPSRARDELGWVPETSFEAMVGEMVAADHAELSATATPGPSAPSA